jgi:F-type H+-transporting ATPase subunit c
LKRSQQRELAKNQDQHNRCSFVSIAGAPLLEGRWIPDTGEIIRLVFPGSRKQILAGKGGCSYSAEEKTTMKKVSMIGLSLLGLLLMAVTAAAQGANQTGAVDNHRSAIAIGAGIGFAIAVFGGAIGQSRIGAAACEGAARNPGAAGRIQTMMILGLALIESLVLFALLIVFTVVKGA